MESSLEDLLQTEVSSVARRSQRLIDTAAAVYVITAEDIQHSGARSIPEALRLAPGVDAARISANRWAVSMRGSNDRFSNKLLVLVNGRNAYNAAFSGVFWEALLLPVSEIQQIEVLRGPGSAAWGTNAVNGVINIITKPAATTPDTTLTLGGGNREGAFAESSHGGRLKAADVHYRVYGKAQKAAAFKAEDGSAHDAYEHGTVGGRVDGYSSKGHAWSVDANAYSTEQAATSDIPVPTAPYRSALAANERIQGGDVRARYTVNQGSGSEFEMQLAYTHTNAELPVLGSDRRNTVDLDLQQRFSGISGHDLSVGASYRRSSTTAESGLQQRFANAPETLRIASLFAQDEITLSPKFKATLGLRLDDHEFSGLEVQPTARLLWKVSPTSSAWISASRAARTPSQGERNVDFTVAYLPPGIPLSIQSDESFGSETLHQAEIGYRAQWMPNFYIDSSVFYHQYTDLRAQRAPELTPTGLVVRLSNDGAFKLIGNETTVEWNLTPHWQLRGNYTYHEMFDVRGQRSRRPINHHQLANIHVDWHPNSALSINGALRYVSARRLTTSVGEQYFPSYLAADLAIRWQATKMVELKLVGQDLLDDCHLEYADTTSGQRLSLVGRGAYAHLLYRF